MSKCSNISSFKTHSKQFQSVNGKVLQDNEENIECQQDSDGNIVCISNKPSALDILNASTNQKSLVSELNTLLNGSSSKSLSRSSFKTSKKKSTKKNKKTKKQKNKKTKKQKN